MSTLPSTIDSTLPFHFTHGPDDIKKWCSEQQRKAKDTIDAIGKMDPKQANFQNSLLKIEWALSAFTNEINPVTFLKDVSTDAEIRKAASACDESIRNFYIDLFVREDLFALVSTVARNSAALKQDEKMLVDEYMASFKQNGLQLPKEKRTTFVEKKKLLVAKEKQFNDRLAINKEGLLFEKSDLEGLPESFVKGLKQEDGKFRVTLNYPHFYPFMENARNPSARKRLEFASSTHGGETNLKLLEEAIALRHELANMLGFPTHAHMVLDRRMAKAPEKVVEGFLKPLVERLKVRGKQDIAEMLALKQKEDPKATEIHFWDYRYYANQLKKAKYQIDNEKIREYFPFETVLDGMFEIYQELLGVRFVEEKNGPRWHDSVRLFRVEDQGKILSYFYMDLFPRDGKYGHAAAFTLLGGYITPEGHYRAPVSAIVANFSAPTATEPSLLQHSEVETLFHEFGHIMHQVLTRARFSTISGTAVKTDFVEAPSQMLENWVWEEAGLLRISGHYKNPSQKLPKATIDNLLHAKLHNAGVQYLRQASFALLDMTYHTSKQVDSTKIYQDIFKNVMMIPIQAGTHPQSSFGHLMGGYDAGYYGYLWSEVYAADMYTRFEKEGLFNQTAGRDYRHWILEPGGGEEPMALIEGFLGRAPNQDAFLKQLGL